jgi:hypothetical protein
VSGANTRRDRLSRSTASSILASSLDSIARTSEPMRVESEAGDGMSAERQGSSRSSATPVTAAAGAIATACWKE